MLDIGLLFIIIVLGMFLIGGIIEKKEERTFKYMDYKTPSNFVSFKID